MKTNWHDVKPDTKKATKGLHPSVFPTPSGISRTANENVYKPRAPVYHPADVEGIYKTTPIARGIFRVIQREMFDVGPEIVPLFEKICRKCKAIYGEGDKVCENGKCSRKGKELDTPDISHKIKAQVLQDEANPDRSGEEVQKGIVNNDLAFANYYVSLSYKFARRFDGVAKKAAGIYLEDPVLIRVVGDDYGHIGDPNQLICISCNDGKVYGQNRTDYADFLKSARYKEDESSFVDVVKARVPRKSTKSNSANYHIRLCPKCSNTLRPTAYVKLKNAQSNEIEARFTKEDMKSGSSTIVPPAYYGVSGLIISWKLLQSLNAMDDLNRQTYTEKHLGAIINWKGMGQDEVNEIIRKSNEIGMNTVEYDPITRQYTSSKGQSQIHLASDEAGIQYISILDDFTKLQSMDFYNKYGDIVGMIYGVPSGYMNWSSEGVGKDPSAQYNIILSGIRERIEWVENEWNKKILPAFGVTDYGIKFGAVSTKEDFRTLQMEKLKADVFRLYAEGGYEGVFTKDNKFIVTGRIPTPQIDTDEESEKEDEEDKEQTSPTKTKGKRLPDSRNPRATISDSSDRIIEG